MNATSEGEKNWERVFRDRPFDQECYAITAVPNGGYLLVGETLIDGPGYEVLVIRTDDEGDEIWQEHYGTEMIDVVGNDHGYGIVYSDDSKFVICGETSTIIGGVNYSVLLLEIDVESELNWMQIIDMGNLERARSITQTIDGGFALSGISDGGGVKPFILKTDGIGNLIWSYLEESVRVSQNNRHHFNVLVHDDRTFSLVCGQLEQAAPTPGFLQKFGRDPHGVADGGSVFLPSWTGLEGAYPNPFNSITTFVFTVGSPANVEIDIFNALGRRQTELVRRSYPVGQHSISWDAGGLPSGDYFARMEANGFSQTIKLVLMK